MKARGIAALDAAALAALAPALPVFERAILDQAPDAERVLKEIKLRTGAGLSSLSRPDAAEPAHDLPVVTATTLGIEVAAKNFDKAPLTTQRPPFLADDPHAFAFLLTDATMSPRYDAGDMLYVSPAREIGENADIVAERKGGGFLLGRLARTTETTVRLVKLQSQESFDIARQDIRGLYRVVGVQRLGG
jgi:phage repressor protein C with HTH and peptisase S24 domain